MYLTSNKIPTCKKTKTVEVFKTNVADNRNAKVILENIRQLFPSAIVNFDFEDCDNILRVESDLCETDILEIKNIVRDLNFEIELLE